MPTLTSRTASLGLCSVAALFLLLAPPLGQSQGTVSATGGSGAPGSAFNIPVTLSLNTGVNVDTLSFGVRITPTGSPLPPALTGTLSFTKDASLPAPSIVDTGAGPDRIGVAWLLPPISPALTGTKALGVLTMTVPANAQPGQTYTIQVTGASGALGGATNVTLTPGLSATLTVTAPPSGGGGGGGGGGTLSVGVGLLPSSLTVAPGGFATYSVSLSATTSVFVNLSCSGLPSGATCSFSPNPADAPGSATLTVSAAAGTPAGTVIFTVTATAGSATGTATATLSVTSPADFTLSLSPSTQTVAPGASAAYAVSISASGGFNATVNLSCSGLPSGAACSFAPNPSAPGTSTLTVSTAATTPPGAVTFTVTGVSGSLSRTATASLTVSGFTLSIAPGTQSVPAGGTVTYTVSLAAVGGFTGTITLSCSGLPAGATCSFSSNPAPLGTAALTVTTVAATPVATATLTITGSSGSLTRSATAVLVIGPPLVLPPVFTAASVTNAASFVGGTISPGFIATIFGTALTKDVIGIVLADRVPLPTELRGTSVAINGFAAPLFAIANVQGSEQINLQVPFQIAGQVTATIVVNNNGVASAPVPINVSPVQPGIFTVDGVAGAILHGSNFQLVTASNAAAKGEGVVLYATGLGPVSAPPATGSAALVSPLSTASVSPLVSVGGLAAEVIFAGLAPGFVGLFQVNFLIPPTAPPGNLDVVIQALGFSSNVVKIAVQ